MSKLFAPNNILENLLCLTCKNHLSVFPVYTNVDGSGGICGRCSVSDDKFIQDRAYENIAQFLIFPCSNQASGCVENFTPHVLEEHEKSCIYQKLNCPTKNYTKCQWQGPHADLMKHFKDNHSRLLLKDSKFELNFINSSKEVALLSVNNDLFIVKKEIDSGKEKLICSVQHLRLGDNPQNYKYFLWFFDGDNKFSCKFSEKNTFNDNNGTTVDASYIRQKLNDPVTIIVTIEIAKSDDKELDESAIIKSNIKKNPNINWELLSNLECPICFDFMLPPIYQCAEGHSICCECKPKITQCPLCKKDVKDTRNFSLEKLAEYLTYPCVYYKMGCTYFCKPLEIQEHEKICEYGPYKCPLSECEHKCISSQIVEHIETSHDAFILKSDRVNTSFDKDTPTVSFYLIKFSDKAFKLLYKYENEKFYWAVQLVGSADECKHFQFEIDIIDHSRNKFRRYAKGLCVTITNDTIFDDSRNYIMMTLEQIAPLITASFGYKVRIVKD